MMRDQENIEKGVQQGIDRMVENALRATKSASTTSQILGLAEEAVRKIAKDKGIFWDD